MVNKYCFENVIGGHLIAFIWLHNSSRTQIMFLSHDGSKSMVTLRVNFNVRLMIKMVLLVILNKYQIFGKK